MLNPVKTTEGHGSNGAIKLAVGWLAGMYNGGPEGLVLSVVDRTVVSFSLDRFLMHLLLLASWPAQGFGQKLSEQSNSGCKDCREEGREVVLTYSVD